MKEELPRIKIVKDILGRQRQFWDDRFFKNPHMFGDDPSIPAQKAAELFKKEGVVKILELGGGLGRDSIFFAQRGFQVHVLDYSESAVRTTTQKAHASGLSHSITAMCHDVRTPLPFDDQSFDACYSQALLSTALMTSEQEFVLDEIRRILKPKGLNIYSVRSTGDPNYGKGTYYGEEIYENVGQGIVNYFNKEKVEHLAKGYEIVGIDEFEEVNRTRKLFRVILIKK